MLLNTFRHVRGIGPTRERALWASGCRTWEDLVEGTGPAGLPESLQESTREQIKTDLNAFRRGDIRYLSGRLAPKEHWRFYRHFRDNIAFLDIETTGMDAESSIVTVIGVHTPKDGTRVFIDGYNLDDFPGFIRGYDILVTFNGMTFDVPFLRGAFYDLDLPPAHIDLRWLARSVGLSGGLKEVERKIGIARPEAVSEISGFDAVILWKQYKRNHDEHALRRLVRYNLEDTVNLERLVIECCNRMYSAHQYLGIEPLIYDAGIWSSYVDVDQIMRQTQK
ncbi:ribonuclease H-like domain-containing protein [Myxococcota bacterium]